MKMRIWSAALAICIGLAALTALHHPAAIAQSPGLKADNFRLTTADRQSYELYRMTDAAAVVIVTQANGCAAVRQGIDALKTLKASYGPRGVEFLMLNSSLADARDAVAAETADYGVPVLMDGQQLVGEQLSVSQAGEAIILDPKTWRVAWRGSAQDAPAALEAVVAGRRPAAGRAAAGCPVAFPERDRAAQFTRISYAQEIAPIIRAKCIECHQPGGIGPMPFTSYERIKAFAPMIRETIRTQRMPPWHVDPQIGRFHEDAGLSDAQKRTIVHWVEAGAQRGEGADPLAAVTFQAPEWPLGKPDLILDIPAYTIPASGTVNYQRPWAANPGTEGRWLRASAFKVSQPRAVHHILTGYMTAPPPAGRPASENLWGATLGTFAVGTGPTVMPDGVGTYIPAGGAVGFQNHYTPFGKQVTDTSQIGLYFYKDKPELVMRSMTIIDPTISIPPNVERHPEVAYLTFPKEALLYGAFIHAHYRGAGSELSIVYPDGTKKMLISTPRYDFNWQRDYSFAEPVRVPAGSKLVANYIYDNSRRNPANPDPNRTVPFGEQSWDEMLYTSLRYRWVDETSSNGVNHDRELEASRAMGMLDDNLDGKVQRAEVMKGSLATSIGGLFPIMDSNRDGVLEARELVLLQTLLGSLAVLR